MVDARICTVVGIDVAKRRHVLCALDAPTGAVRQRPKTIEATADGYQEVCRWLAGWGEPETLLIGLEATGCLWEPLYDALTQASYEVVILNPRQTAAWAASLGLRAKTDGLDAQTLAHGLLAGYARASTVPPETVQARGLTPGYELFFRRTQGLPAHRTMFPVCATVVLPRSGCGRYDCD